MVQQGKKHQSNHRPQRRNPLLLKKRDQQLGSPCRLLLRQRLVHHRWEVRKCRHNYSSRYPQRKDEKKANKHPKTSLKTSKTRRRRWPNQRRKREHQQRRTRRRRRRTPPPTKRGTVHPQRVPRTSMPPREAIMRLWRTLHPKRKQRRTRKS